MVLLIIVCLKLVFTAFRITNTENNNSSIDIAEQSAQGLVMSRTLG